MGCGDSGPLSPRQTGAPSVTLAAGSSPQTGPRHPPQPSAPISTGRDAAGTRGLVAVVVAARREGAFAVGTWLGKEPCQWRRNSCPSCTPNPGQVSEAAMWALELRGAPLLTGSEVWLQAHSPRRSDFLLSAGHGWPLSSASKLCMSILSSLKPLPQLRPRPVQDSQQAGPTGAQREPPAGWTSFPRGLRDPRWGLGPLSICRDSKCPRLAPGPNRCHQDAAGRGHSLKKGQGGWALILHQNAFTPETQACQAELRLPGTDVATGGLGGFIPLSERLPSRSSSL